MSSETSTSAVPPPGWVEFVITRPGFCGGKPHLAGRRVKVQPVAVWHERMGLTPDEIASTYHLSLAEVYAALANYWNHKVEIATDIQEAEQFADQLRNGAPSIFAKVRQRHAPDDPLPPG